MDLATFYATILLIEVESEKKCERERERLEVMNKIKRGTRVTRKFLQIYLPQ